MSTSSQEAFKKVDASSYDSVVDEFDHFTERFTTPLALKMVMAAGVKPGERVLDIGTGTGIVALEAARRIGSQGKLVGIDLSDRMLQKAEVRAQQAGLTQVTEFSNMDAENLSLPDGSFDVVFSLFSLLHLPNPSVGLSEMKRVLKPGGRLVLAVGSPPPIFSLAGTRDRIARAFELIGRARGTVLCAPQFLNELVDQSLPDRGAAEESDLARNHQNRTGAVPDLVRRAGFSHLDTFWEGYCASLDTAEEFWDLQRTYSSIARKRLESAPAEAVARIREEFMKRCSTVLSRNGRLVYHYAAFYVSARA